MLVSFCLITNDRIIELLEAIYSIYILLGEKPSEIEAETIILFNGTTQSTIANNQIPINQIKSFEVAGIKIITSETNKGVAGGRNLCYQASKGDILVFLDDDATINTQPSVFWEEIQNYYHNFSENKIGAVAFKSISPDGSIRKKETPTNTTGTKTLVGSFVGVGHVLIRSALGNIKFLYPDNLFFGMEEFYLSYWLIFNGFFIEYNPSLEVIHNKSNKTRLDIHDYFIHQASNKVYIAFLTRNRLDFAIFFCAWSYWLLKKTRFALKSQKRFLVRLAGLINETDSNIHKFCLTKKHKGYLKSVNAKLYF